MKIYIASSWKNQHAVEMLTALLRESKHEVISWVENNYGEDHNHVTKKFEFDIHGAMVCDLLIYVGPSGKDEAAEVGMCYGQRLAGKTIPIFGLTAKGEDFGLMRKMMDAWYNRYIDLISAVNKYNKNPHDCFGRKPNIMDFDSHDEFDARLYDWMAWEDDHKNKS